MYLLQESNRPFAIVSKPKEGLFVKAIEEEFSVTDVKLNSFILPDWGEVKEIQVEAKSIDDGDLLVYDLEIIKLVTY